MTKDRISNDKQRISILIDRQVYATVKRAAAEKGISGNELMTTAIATYLSASTTPAELQRQVDELELQFTAELAKVKQQLQLLS